MMNCPIRGELRSSPRQDGLTPNEERRRIECIQLLLAKGYPKDHIEAQGVLVDLGAGARHPLRADVVVYDRPITVARRQGNIVRRRQFIYILARIKRDRLDPQTTKDQQLRPALALIAREDAIGIYWGDAEQSILIKQMRSGSVELVESSISCLRPFDAATAARGAHHAGLRGCDLRPVLDLVKPFAQLDDILHQAGLGKEERYALLFKLLLIKIFDEENARPPQQRLLLQDFSTEQLTDREIESVLQALLGTALDVYGGLLPGELSRSLACSGATLRELSRVLAPIHILGSSPQVLQDFFMYFGRFLYKVDLGPYFTPYELIELIVHALNPGPADCVIDPACGAADFLVAAQRLICKRHGASLAQQLKGVDAAETAVGLSRFNLLLHGGRHSSVSRGDSLRSLAELSGQHTVAVCNPPFGVRLLEKRQDVLKGFELAADSNGKPGGSCKPQETGLLFVEVCLKSVKPGGRVGLILPNGYLGNRGPRYVAFRRWLLCHARIAAVIGFPRFTFKRAGADVSASAVILERREQPQPEPGAACDYPIHFNLVDKVGWDLQSSHSGRLYKRDPRDGSLMRGAEGELLLDADFDRVLKELYGSAVVDAFPWMQADARTVSPRGGGCVQASVISAREDLCLDPKRWCPKHAQVVAAVRDVRHLAIGDVVCPVVRAVRARADVRYRYVEIEKIYEAFGAYIAEECPGWALPRRAKLRAAPRDLFIANIWSSAGKWMIAGEDALDGHLLVTTGCTQFALIPGRESLLPDLVFGLCSEAFRVQMRARASGSDGLSSIATEDITSIILPRLDAGRVRTAIEQRLKDAHRGHLMLPRMVREELAQSAPGADIPMRSSHTAQV
jgi:type I restriction enzyme M protein